MSAMSGAVTAMPATPTANAAAKPAAPAHHGFSFGDFLDIINPLQHIPIINTLYRKLTGDEMSPTAEIAGGALFGGIVGAVTSVADVLFTQATGKNIGDTVFAWLGFEDKNPTTQLAKAASPTATRAPAPALAVTPASITAAAASATPPVVSPDIPGLNKLMGALDKQRVDPAIAARAAFAYRSAIGLPFQTGGPRAPSY